MEAESILYPPSPIHRGERRWRSSHYFMLFVFLSFLSFFFAADVLHRARPSVPTLVPNLLVEDPLEVRTKVGMSQDHLIFPELRNFCATPGLYFRGVFPYINRQS